MPQDFPIREKGLQDYLGAIWRRKWIVLLTAVLAVGVAVGIDLNKHKTYTATAQILVSVPGSTNNPTALNPNAQPDIPTDIQLIQSSQVQGVVRHQLKLSSAPPPVSASQVGTSNVVSISATSTNPDTAAEVANAYASAYIVAARTNYTNSIQGQINQLQAQINQLQTQIDQINLQLANASRTGPGPDSSSLGTQLGTLLSQQETLKTQLNTLQQSALAASGGQVVTPASSDSVVKHPNVLQDVLFALGVGVLVGIALALLRDFLDDRIRGREELEAVAPGLPIIGMIPDVPDWRDRRKALLVELARPRSPAAEAYRSLRTSIQFMAVDQPVKLLQITSAAQGEGKTTTSANLAVAMAEAGSRVVLVSCDLRKPRIHEFFGLSNEEGLTSVLLGEVNIHEALTPVPEVANLSLLGSGPVPPNPSELLAGAQARQIFRQLCEEHDVVVLDSSPVLPVADGSVLAGFADAVLLVAAANVSTKRDITRSMELLERVSANVVGTILNRAAATDAYAYYRYGYGYGYGAAPETATDTSVATSNGADPTKAVDGRRGAHAARRGR
jgi:capsular exopolysaccharide synthesis family protein